MNPVPLAPLILLAALLQPPEAVPITPGLIDLSPLSLDPAVQPIYLDSDAGFRRVYRLGGTPSLTGGAFMRRSGAITAVFARSAYADRSGDALIPAGTVFLIGPPPVAPTPRSDSAALFPRADLSVPNEPPRTPPRAKDTPALRPASIWTDEAYRVARVSGWLDVAMGR